LREHAVQIEQAGATPSGKPSIEKAYGRTAAEA
jgi:hypothetical protein